ncbi:hypothetical protein BLA29_011748, partial [Euroglyphus maynei]
MDRLALNYLNLYYCSSHLRSNRIGGLPGTGSGCSPTTTANYMPLYSSDTAEDDDCYDHKRSCPNGHKDGSYNNEDEDEQHQPHEDEHEKDYGLRMGLLKCNVDNHNDYEATGDMTKPLVDDIDDEIDDDDEII